MIERGNIAGVILAGGLSMRMGGTEKGLLTLSDKPLIAHVRDRLAPQVGAMVLNANGDPARFSGLGLQVVADTVQGFAGPLAGVLAGMRWAVQNRQQATHVASAAGDTPFFPRDLVARLADAVGAEADAIAIARSGPNRHPVFGLWPVSLADELESFLRSDEGGKVMLFAQRYRQLDVDFAFLAVPGGAADPFFNVNTPQELIEAQAIATRLADGAQA